MAAYEVLLLNTAIPQIQAAQAGDTYVVPRDIAINASMNVTGNTTLGDASTDTVTVNGYMGVGGAASSDVAVKALNTLNALYARGFRSQVTAGSGTTIELFGYHSALATSAASFTLSTIAGFVAGNPTLGSGSAITNAHGVIVNDQTVGTNNYGITSLVSSGTNKWNIYASGTAANYFAGNVLVGSTTVKTNIAGVTPQLQINGSTANNSSLLLTRNSNDPNPPAIWFGKDRAGAIAQASDVSGLLRFTAFDGTNYVESVNIRAEIVGTVSSGIAPGIFKVSVANSSGTLRERINADQTETVINNNGDDCDFRVESDTNTHALFVEGTNSNVKIGGSAERGTTVGTNHLDIFNGTAPVGTLTNGISIYSSSGEAYVMDAAGNATLFSPHDAETNEWIFKSKHTPSGKVLKIDVEKMLRFINDHFGLDAIHEFTEE